jgi:undecaprenyl-diphosphatase
MLATLQAILLGVIQGISEFLPISSTAHLTLFGNLLGLIQTRHPEAWTSFIAVMQLGTMASMVVYFYGDLKEITISLFHDLRTRGLRHGFSGYSRDSLLALYIALGTIPVAFVGFFFNQTFEGDFTKNLSVIAYAMVLFALFLWLAEKGDNHSRTLSEVTWKDALVIGIAQVLALIPGASRSGTTITAALLMGMKRGAAARFSLLLSIPAVLASGFLELFKMYHLWEASENVMQFSIVNVAVATIVAGVTGYFTISWLVSYLLKNTTLAMVWYRLGVGILMFVLLATGLV